MAEIGGKRLKMVEKGLKFGFERFIKFPCHDEGAHTPDASMIDSSFHEQPGLIHPYNEFGNHFENSQFGDGVVNGQVLTFEQPTQGTQLGKDMAEIEELITQIDERTEDASEPKTYGQMKSVQHFPHEEINPEIPTENPTGNVQISIQPEFYEQQNLNSSFDRNFAISEHNSQSQPPIPTSTASSQLHTFPHFSQNSTATGFREQRGAQKRLRTTTPVRAPRESSGRESRVIEIETDSRRIITASRKFVRETEGTGGEGNEGEGNEGNEDYDLRALDSDDDNREPIMSDDIRERFREEFDSKVTFDEFKGGF